MQRINLGKAQPKTYQLLFDLNTEINRIITDAEIDAGFMHLLKLHASQLNGCAFCINMHVQDALKANESQQRINLLQARHETNHYNTEELAALDLVEAITHVSDQHVPDQIYHNALTILGEKKVVAIEWLAIMINSWNRVAIASRY